MRCIKYFLVIAFILCVTGCTDLTEDSQKHFAYSEDDERPTHHLYKKWTSKTIKMGEESNANFLKFENLRKIHQGVPMEVLLKQIKEPDSCTQKYLHCDRRSPYRTFDGTCNNLQHQYWGASFTFFNRLAPPAYWDRRNEPRGGFRSILPNPRLISTNIHPDLIQPDPGLTNFIPQFGQFLDHDLTFSPESNLACCGRQRNNMDCWPIQIPPRDYFYSRRGINQTCLPFTRSTPFCFPQHGGVRQQMNALTAFVDASQVYGSDSTRARELRRLQGGKLLVSEDNLNFLPTVTEVQRRSGKRLEIMGNFAAGDDRVNEMPALTVMHTLFVREHNRLASCIQNLRPRWSDEAIFQAARRIFIAQWQKIVYGDYLPIILGSRVMAQYDLTVTRPPRHTNYNLNMDPTIFQAFATAAYRFGHTLINGLIRLMRDVNQVGSYQVRNGFFNDAQIKQNRGEGYDLILGGLMQQNAQTYDRFVTEDLTNFLLREPRNAFGEDLLARNVQRGRDHGVPPYQTYRQMCKLASLTSWANNPPEFPRDTWQKLRALYRTPQDIDLFTGGLSELPLAGAVTGPTFNCLKAMQFHRLKFGDRFFFTHGGQAGSFTPYQLEQISRVTLGDLICLNSRIGRTPENVFRTVSYSNPWINCNDRSRRRLLNVANFL